MSTLTLLSLLLVLLLLIPAAADSPPLPGTRPLEMQGDLAAQMVDGLDRYVTRETVTATAGRAARWRRDFSSSEAYERSVAPNRERLRRILGVVDARVKAPVLQPAGTLATPAAIARGKGYRVLAVRWPALEGVDGEGLLLEPDGAPRAAVIALPDCDWTPEMLAGLAPGVPEAAQFARRLAEQGCRVMVPALVDRRSEWSALEGQRRTNIPHREFIYRAAFELGHHVIGYEVQKVLAGVDALAALRGEAFPPTDRIGIFGYGEGGLIALYSGALDPQLLAVGVSGYFQPREELWREPIYRNVWGLLEEFGDAEVASLIAPRPLLVEASAQPKVDGPPKPPSGRGEAAPGVIRTPPLAAVSAEVERARKLVQGFASRSVVGLIAQEDGQGLPGSNEALKQFLASLGGPSETGEKGAAPGVAAPEKPSTLIEEPAAARARRQFDQLVAHTQRLLAEAEFRRGEFWAKADAGSAKKWSESAKAYRARLSDEVIGRFPAATVPASPRSRLIYDTPAFRGYEVVLDVWPDVYAYGILLLPKDLKPGERRPVVVCQHGLEGRPQDVANPEVDNPAYHRYACQLAERGFITFAPQNPYIGGDRFRVLQRKANPIGKSLFSFIVRQHERILEWLGEQPFVDRERIAFYGLSYGGKTAMRVPAMLEGYCLSICSADYNEWIWKNASTRHRYSYLFTGEYEMPEFNLGNTFNYAELSWLIFPRPFMVERGHQDGVAPDEWVAYEYARTRRHYDRFGLGDRTELEVFNGPHTINGVGTFAFLERHLRGRRP